MWQAGQHRSRTPMRSIQQLDLIVPSNHHREISCMVVHQRRPHASGLVVERSERLLCWCRYAAKLDAHSSQINGKVRPMVPKELLCFCVTAGYNCRLEPQGTLLQPPEIDVPLSDWERGVKLR